MKLKNKFALIIALTAFQFVNFGGAVEATEIDKELAIIAAEQDNGSGEVFTPAQNAVSNENFSGDDKKKIIEENSANTSANNSTTTTESSEPVEEIVSVTEEVVTQPETATTPAVVEEVKQPETATTPAVVQEEVKQPETATTPVVEEKLSQPANLANQRQRYANFEELAQALKFTPLYVPKKSGYNVTELFSVANQTAEIRYGRRWEPEVALIIRTYKRPEGEGLKDISGIQGVKWRIDTTSGSTVYIAKINERAHVAAWASGSYTFAAYIENISFAAFHSLVIDELVDLTTHYYTN